MKKTIYNIIFGVYAIIAVFVTICLLSYNEYKVTEFGNSALIIINDDELSPDFAKGDLVIVNQAKTKEVNVGDKIFFYTTYDKNVNINLAEITKKEVITTTETTYTVEGDYVLSSQSVIGSSDTVTKLPKVGTVLGILESKWGFLFLIVLPSLIAFVYEIGVVFSEIKESKKGSNKGNN